MVHKNQHTTAEGAPPLDDSWWTAILEEVESQFSAPKQTSTQMDRKDQSGSQQIKIDWDLAKQLYDQDQVVDLQVTGFNRGGLLVDGQDIQGFVPISHLVGNFKDRAHEDRETLLVRMEEA